MFFRHVLAASVTSLLSECLSGENLPTLMVQIFTVHKHSVAFIGTPCNYRWLNDLLILPAATVTVLGVVIMLFNMIFKFLFITMLFIQKLNYSI